VEGGTGNLLKLRQDPDLGGYSVFLELKIGILKGGGEHRYMASGQKIE